MERYWQKISGHQVSTPFQTSLKPEKNTSSDIYATTGRARMLVDDDGKLTPITHFIDVDGFFGLLNDLTEKLRRR